MEETMVTQKEAQEQALQERRQHDEERMKMQHGRNAHMQKAPEGQMDPEQVDGLIKQEYSHLDQPGLDPANMPSRDSYSTKTTRDLEDITGNPGHRNVNPNAPATSINRTMPDARDNPASINEPPDVRQAPLSSGPPSINEPPGSNVQPEAAAGKKVEDDDETEKERKAREAKEAKEDRDEHKKHK